MNHQKVIRLKNRMISWFPWISVLSEQRRLLQSARIWREQGWFNPPPYFIRRAMLLKCASSIKAGTFVETGTYMGDTPWAFRHHFDTIYTIEVDPDLAELARSRFRKIPSIHPIEGDSAVQLANLCACLNSPTLFFLDGHYSGGFTGKGAKDCPIHEELSAILHHVKVPFRIVIDDARLFGTDPEYPTLDGLRDHLKSLGWEGSLRVENDAILLGDD